MPKWIATLCLAVILVGFSTITGLAQNQAQITLDKVEIDLWPEYDRSDMLVIERVTLTSGVTLPTDMTLRIPKAAGQPYNLAFRNTDGQLYTLPFTKSTNGDWVEVTFNTPSDQLQLEYYDPGLVKQGNQRTFTYTWPASFAVNTVTIQAQQPVGATNFQVTPEAGPPVTGDGGLLYYSSEVGSVKVGQSFTAQVRYQKTNDELSVQAGQVIPAAPITNETPGRATLSGVWWWLLGLVAILLIVSGGYWYLHSSRPTAVPVRRRHATGHEAVLNRGGGDEPIYCHQCGKRASPGDVFCRSCGTRLRKDE